MDNWRYEDLMTAVSEFQQQQNSNNIAMYGDIAEERKGSNAGRNPLEESASEEMYDNFDGDAVQLGVVDMRAMVNPAFPVG